MNSNDVAIAAIALAGTATGAVVWVVKYLAKTLSGDLQAHTAAAVAQAAASKKQEEASKEVLIFMKKLNGSLPKIVTARQEVARDES